MKPARVKDAAKAADEQIAALKAGSESPPAAADLVVQPEVTPALQVVPPVELAPAPETPPTDVAGQLSEIRAELVEMTVNITNKRHCMQISITYCLNLRRSGTIVSFAN